MESRKIKRETKTKTSNKSNKQPAQISIFTILFVLLIIAAAAGIYMGVKALVITLKYKSYTDKMYTYGYNEFYENNKATAVQSVSNGEMLSAILGSLTNTKNVENVYYLADANSTEQLNWYNYSNYLGVNDVVNKGQLSEKASKINSAMILVRMIEGYLNVEIEKADLEMKENILNGYSKEQQEIIAKAVTLGLIKNKTSDIKNKEIIKGELNKYIIDTVEKYATIHYFSNDKVNIVTKKSEMPENYKEYPYIIDSIDNNIYELDYKVMTKSNFKTPKEVYKQMGDLYGQTDYRMVEYFDTLLNVDYETITVETFLENVNYYSEYTLHAQDVEQYVKYVKNNKIKLQGNAVPLLPIIYNNGEHYQIRTKITFRVLSSDTEYNLLFGDENNKVKYNSKEITIYVDVPMGITFNSRTLLVQNVCFAKYLSQKTSAVVVEE